MVTKTLSKDVKRGNTLMLDPGLLDFLENIKITPHGIINIGHLFKDPRVVCDASARPKIWCHAINDWTSKHTEPRLIFATAFKETLRYIWNLRITYPRREIYGCDDDITNAFRQIKYPPNLAGLHSKVVGGILYVDTGQTFGDSTSPSNHKPVAINRSQHAQALWYRSDTIARTLHFLPPIEHQDPPTPAEQATFVQANRDSLNPGVLDDNGQRLAPLYRHHVDDCIYADVAEHLVQTVCASALALFEILGFPDDTRQIPALSMEKLDTMYRPQRKMVGYRIDTRAMNVALLQYKRDETSVIIEPWLTMTKFTLLQGATLCGKLESASSCNRWIRPYFFNIQNAIQDALIKEWQKVRAIYARTGNTRRNRFQLPESLAHRLGPLIARDKAKLLWHAGSVFDIPQYVQSDLALLQDWLRDPTVKWEKSIAHWIPRDSTFVSAGDASQVAGGAFSEELKCWFDVYWSPKVKKGCQLPSNDKGFIHINSLEYIVVLLQLTLCIVALESGYAVSLPDSAIPEIPHLLVWTDNTASKSWANKVTSTSRKAQPLISILSSLLRRNNVGFSSEHIAGVNNDIPDFISRPDRANEIALTHYQRCQQIFAHDVRLKSWAFFRPSQELILLLESALFSEHWAVPPSLPKNLGHFELSVSTSSSFVSI